MNIKYQFERVGKIDFKAVIKLKKKFDKVICNWNNITFFQKVK